jgi:hypothetical protein
MIFALTHLAAFLPMAIIGILSKLATQSFVQSVLEKVLIYGLRKAAAMTSNTVDDELVEEVAQRLQNGGAP